MGTPEEKIFVDPSQKDGLPDIIDDFDLDFNAGSEEWIQHKAKEDNLQKFTESTEIHVIHPPRAANENSNNDGTTITTSSAASCKPLLVLDLDHTLLDFSSSHLRDNGSSAMAIGQSTDAVANQLKRPYMDEFLTWTYKYYDLVVWSQTSWRWLEVSHLNLLRGFVLSYFWFLFMVVAREVVSIIHIYQCHCTANILVSFFHFAFTLLCFCIVLYNIHYTKQIKLTELGMLTHPGYKICFVLDKTSMFQIVSTNRSGKKVTHSVKPLQIIWSKFPHWNNHNTVHLDDLSRNFALNLGSGLKCTAYYRKKKKRKNGKQGGVNDAELLGFGRFLELLATNDEVRDDFNDVNFDDWEDYVSGKRDFQKKK